MPITFYPSHQNPINSNHLTTFFPDSMKIILDQPPSRFHQLENFFMLVATSLIRFMDSTDLIIIR